MIPSSLKLSAIVACEIEFTLVGSAARNLDAFWQEVRAACAQSNVPIENIEKERGLEQHEVALMPESAECAAASCMKLKNMIAEIAAKHEMQALFAAKLFDDQPGNGLHVHVHLEDDSGKNVFYKNDAEMSNALRWSIGGLMHWMIPHMPVFAPTPESYRRFHHAGDHTPTTVSWGANNRTCALRLPDSGKYQKRIEHRVAGADADPAAVIEAIVAAIHYGLSNQIEPPAQIYGNAGDAMYGLVRLPQSWEEANATRASSLLPAP